MVLAAGPLASGATTASGRTPQLRQTRLPRRAACPSGRRLGGLRRNRPDSASPRTEAAAAPLATVVESKGAGRRSSGARSSTRTGVCCVTALTYPSKAKTPCASCRLCSARHHPPIVGIGVVQEYPAPGSRGCCLLHLDRPDVSRGAGVQPGSHHNQGNARYLYLARHTRDRSEW